MTITLYSSPTCPKCKVLKMKLDMAGIEYAESHDLTYLEENGIRTLPYLRLEDNTLLDFGEAVKFVKNQEG